MQAAERPEFTPPPQAGLVRGLLFALLAHGLLMAALTWGVRWNREDTALSVEAELWSATPQQAAPRPVEPPPPPPAPPRPAPVPAPPPPPPVTRDADLALEREKQRQAQEKQREAEQERQRKLAEQKKQDALKKQEEQARAAKQREEQAAKLREELRREQIKRAQGLAGATGNPEATGTALRSSGPSASYAGRIAAAIKRNVVFNDVVAGNPATEVRIRVAPDGTIVGKTLLRSSGNKAWDDAVLRAIDRTVTIPRDTDGRVVPEFPVTFRPND